MTYKSIESLALIPVDASGSYWTMTGSIEQQQDIKVRELDRKDLISGVRTGGAVLIQLQRFDRYANEVLGKTETQM